MVTSPWCWENAGALHKLALSSDPTKPRWQEPAGSEDSPPPGPHVWMLHSSSVPAGLTRQRENAQRVREWEEGKTVCSQQLPSNYNFCFLEQLLGAVSLAGLPAERGVRASSQPAFVAGRCWAVLFFFPARAFKSQQPSLLCYCSYQLVNASQCPINNMIISFYNC